MHRVRTSRRIPPLEDGDIDHEIKLVDHSASIQGSSEPLNAETDNAVEDMADHSASSADPPLTALTSEGSQAWLRDGAAPPPTNDVASAADKTSTDGGGVAEPPHPSKDSETAIDILYENERGGFLCGIPLFSAAALGNLDPPAWTNYAHRPSPTNPKTAQVPDPSWEWAWPEWQVNHDPETKADAEGWEYSFMFHKKFSWHGPKWWNSFVRRRAWIRRRVKKGIGYQANDPHLLNPEYFTVSSPMKHRKSMSAASSLVASTGASCQVYEEDFDEEQQADIETIGTLMEMLRRSRIDREKLNVVQNYLEHGTDNLLQLQEHMHEIMSIFVFQASRRLLLTKLTNFHDEATRQQQTDGSSELGERVKNLATAVEHADEEVRRLEFWSDVKGMAENGESHGAVDDGKGWKGGFEGIDKSGPVGANKKEIP
ncbi:uncharacterized protein BCR38DRAFT_457568 [Pseudomassariella vexata]|uniref:Peroxin/Ferlin domain-containing protein n=1 Tax=Pseudomassariella vexata TaxID=1141098 RepID=A0A1Y2E1H5_9PEZI|nr:uncharacterized protein BCR38DRAFT_457568 [Pseudomassariella vexata]ORY65401.1 hypothetical protein BCR38DRAFT_457568 [Pseudomassariella vexata]